MSPPGVDKKKDGFLFHSVHVEGGDSLDARLVIWCMDPSEPEE